MRCTEQTTNNVHGMGFLTVNQHTIGVIISLKEYTCNGITATETNDGIWKKNCMNRVATNVIRQSIRNKIRNNEPSVRNRAHSVCRCIL